jgi:hypothetical protein
VCSDDVRAGVDRELPRPLRHVVVVVVEAEPAGEWQRSLERVQLVVRRVAHEMGEARAVRGPAGPIDEYHPVTRRADRSAPTRS